MKKRIITMSEYRRINPYGCGQLLLQLEKCRVKPKNMKPKNFKNDFSKDSIEKYICNTIFKN